jgi:hypothetical protein
MSIGGYRLVALASAIFDRCARRRGVDGGTDPPLDRTTREALGFIWSG